MNQPLTKDTVAMDMNVIAGSALYEAVGRLTDLRELEVMCRWPFFEEEPNPYPGFGPFLQALPSPNSISKIQIRVYFGSRSSASVPGQEFWDGIDLILSDRIRFPKLACLDFKIRTTRDVPLDKPAWEEYEQEERVYWRACKAVGVEVNFFYTERLYNC
jgi:hypothetical protein